MTASPAHPYRLLLDRQQQSGWYLLVRLHIHIGLDARLAAQVLRVAAPETYVNGRDYFQPDWRKVFGGPTTRGSFKGRYDPDGLLFGHNGVRSEDWSKDGFTRLR
jgi:hypothetical protein